MPQRGKTSWARPAPGTLCRALVCCAALGGYLFIIAAGGADMGRLVLFYLCAAVYLIGPGLALADWVGPHAPGLRAPLAMLYGIGFLAGVHCVCVHFGLYWLLRLLPAAVTAVWAARKLRAWRAAGRPRPALPPVWANGVVLWALLCLLYAVFQGALNPHPLAAGPVDLARDMLWNTGNTVALGRHFPAEDIRFAGVTFAYHYLTELLAAALRLASGASAYDINAYFLGPLFLAGELIALCSLGAHYFGPARRRAAHLTVYLLFGFQSLAMWKVSPTGDGIFGNTLLKHLVTNINAQATALIMSCVFMVLFITVSRQKFAVGPLYMADLLLAFALLCVAKGPQAGIVVCSLTVTMLLVLAFQKPRYGRALFCLAGCGAVFACLYALLFSGGAGSSMALSAYTVENSYAYRYLLPWADRVQALLHLPMRWPLLVVSGVLNAFCMAPFQFLLWGTGLPRSVRRLPQLDPACLLANGAVVGGFLAYHLFYHTSSSQVYFAQAALLFLAPLAADRLDVLLQSRPLRPRSWPLWLAGAAAALTTVCIVGACARTAAAQLAATLGVGPTLATERRAAPEDEAAMRWLAENTPETLVFATNRIDSSTALDDGISNLYTAFSGRQSFMEGWKYAYTNMGVAQAEVLRRLAVRDTLFDPAAPESAVRALCAEEGIGCLVWAKAWGGGVTPALTPAYENGEVAIYLLQEASAQ